MAVTTGQSRTPATNGSNKSPTFGGHSQLPPGKLAELLSEIGASIDRVGGTFTMGYNAIAVTATRTG